MSYILLAMYNKLLSFSEYTKHATTILFFVGFLFDMFILPDIDDPISRLLGACYIGAIAFLIMFREWVVSRNTASKREQKLYSLSTLGIAYFSGSALSFICVYAIRSAAFSVSWPLLLVLALCVFANEFIASHHFRFTLDVGVLLVATVFFIIFNMPVLLKVQNDMTFVVSLVLTTVVSLLYLYFLKFTSESASEEAPKLYSLGIGIPMFIGMLYFLNVIPAVPLSLKHGGIYHSVVRDDAGDFIVQGEKDTRIFSSLRKDIYHLSSSDNGVYFFSAVDAPAELSAPITHVWEYYDTATSKWVGSTVVSFTLAGGRDDGYRAYSQKENITDGLWRVTVKVDSKRVVGRVTFRIVRGNEVRLIESKL